MEKKITVTLSDKATKYFYDRMYGDVKDDGVTPCSQSEAISHCLESLGEFEKVTDNQLEGWLADYDKLNSMEKVFAADPTHNNYVKMLDESGSEPEGKEAVEYWKARCEAAELNIETYSEWHSNDFSGEGNGYELFQTWEAAFKKWQELKHKIWKAEAK